MEQSEYALDNNYENFEDKWRDEELLKKLEENSHHCAKMSWTLFYASLTALIVGFGVPWLYIESGWRYPMMLFSVILGAVLYLLSFLYARRSYIFYENRASKTLRGFHVYFFIIAFVILLFFLGMAYSLWIFSGFAPYPQKPFWIWLLG